MGNFVKGLKVMGSGSGYRLPYPHTHDASQYNKSFDSKGRGEETGLSWMLAIFRWQLQDTVGVLKLNRDR